MTPREIIESIKKARDFAMQSLRTDWAQAGSDPPADCVQRGHEATEWLRKVEECPLKKKGLSGAKAAFPQAGPFAQVTENFRHIIVFII